MKGIVFTEFFEMVEKEFGYEIVDFIIENTDLPSKGIYTAVGTYQSSEMNNLVLSLSQKSGIPIKDLLKKYGRYLHGTFSKNYLNFFLEEKDSLDFLERVDSHIHQEVRKIYPDAELPNFETTRLSKTCLEMIYSSKRRMSHFAEGLIEETLMYYNQKGTITRTPLREDGSLIKFIIKIQE